MSKYEPLWAWIKANQQESFTMTYDEIREVLGFSLDHSFLNAKKELTAYGFRVGKISMKAEIVAFERLDEA